MEERPASINVQSNLNWLTYKRGTCFPGASLLNVIMSMMNPRPYHLPLSVLERG
jgi:hypothetical protein